MRNAQEGQTPTPADDLNTSLNTVSPEYFDTMGMRILSGRAFRESDGGVKPFRVVVNQTFARQFFAGASAVGKRLGNGQGPRYEIIGVVNDAKYRSLREPVPPVLYNLYTRSSGDSFVLCVRTRMQPGSLIQPVRRALAALDPALPFIEIHTLAEEVDASAAFPDLGTGHDTMLFLPSRIPCFRLRNFPTGALPSGHRDDSAETIT
jgi:MacB-like periplasmic core domain